MEGAGNRAEPPSPLHAGWGRAEVTDTENLKKDISTISSAAKEAKSSERSRRKHYSEEFRQEALRILEKGRTATQLARELGLSTWSLCQWKKRYGVGKNRRRVRRAQPAGPFGGDAAAVALAAEVASLRVEPPLAQ